MTSPKDLAKPLGGRNAAAAKIRALAQGLWLPVWPGWALPVALYLTALLAPMVALTTVHWSEGQAYARLAAQGANRLTLYGAALDSEVEKFRNLPLVLSGDPQVLGLLRRSDPAAVQSLNLRLQVLSEAVRAAAIYVLDRDGLTLAASNWGEGSGSFVGRRFDFRPYFTEAMEGREGHYFALGNTSNQPGYYQTMPVAAEGRVLGAVVVKMALDGLERGWAGGAERVFVTDRHGIVIVTNTPGWRFHSMAPLSAETEREVAESHQYGDEPVLPLPLERGARVIRLEGRGYVLASRPFGEGCTLNVLMDVAEARARARDLGMLAVLAMGLAMGGLFFLMHRRTTTRSHTRELERRVEERTQALRAQQDELVQAAKLAALGQMSAGMAHEVNQPLAALRGYADNALVFLNLGRVEQVRANLREITDLTERMARITGQLKQFARKSAGDAQPVRVGTTVDAALALLAGRLRDEQVALTWPPPDDSLRVWGDDVRLQQVLVNLIRNALDAMAAEPSRRLSIRVTTLADTVSIIVHDSGPGIGAEALSHLCEPFFTTKPAGEGLGLGLSISDRILRDLGGRLSAANHPDGGAVFTLTLRKVDATP